MCPHMDMFVNPHSHGGRSCFGLPAVGLSVSKREGKPQLQGSATKATQLKVARPCHRFSHEEIGEAAVLKTDVFRCQEAMKEGKKVVLKPV